MSRCILILLTLCWISPVNAEQHCDRYCLTQQLTSFSPLSYIFSKHQQSLERWAGSLLITGQEPLYLSYMTAYDKLIDSELDQYWVRYNRRKLTPEALTRQTEILGHSTEIGLVLTALSSAQNTPKKEVDDYLKRLMWVRIRESRRYLLDRFDHAYGLSRITERLERSSVAFFAAYIGQPLFFSNLMHEAEEASEEAHRKSLAWLTFALKHISDQELRSAIAIYELPDYQHMLDISVSAIDLHFERLKQKNHL